MKKILIMAAVCLMAVATFAAQCAATTKKGTQCKRQASPGSQYCWQHGGTTKAERAAGGADAAPVQTRRAPQRGENAGTIVATESDGRCQATTKAGTQCKRKAQSGSKFCFQHGGEAAGGVEPEAAPAPRRTRKAKAEPAEEKASSEKPAAVESAPGELCAAKTKDGSPCKRKAKPGSKFCWQHDK